MKTKFVVSLALLGLLLMPAAASAVYMDFDSLTLGSIEGVHLGTFPDGVTFTSEFGGSIVTDGFGVGWTSPYQAVTNTGFMTNNALTLTFDRGRGIVSFVGGDQGGDFDQFSVTAYDSNHVLLGTITTPVFGGNALPAPDSYMQDQYRVTLEWADMKYVVIHDAINAGIGIDDLEFCRPVPLPPSFLLLGSGLLGVGLLRFRRKNRA